MRRRSRVPRRSSGQYFRPPSRSGVLSGSIRFPAAIDDDLEGVTGAKASADPPPEAEEPEPLTARVPASGSQQAVPGRSRRILHHHRSALKLTSVNCQSSVAPAKHQPQKKEKKRKSDGGEASVPPKHPRKEQNAVDLRARKVCPVSSCFDRSIDDWDWLLSGGIPCCPKADSGQAQRGKLVPE